MGKLRRPVCEYSGGALTKGGCPICAQAGEGRVTERKGRAGRGEIIGAVLGGCVLAPLWIVAVAVLWIVFVALNVVPLAWLVWDLLKGLWGLVLRAWGYLGAEVPTARWALLVLAAFAVACLVRAIARRRRTGQREPVVHGAEEDAGE